MAKPQAGDRIPIEMDCTGRAVGKMRNEMEVCLTKYGMTYEIATDEGSYLGGDGTAPPPLALMTAALTGCLMTQIRTFAKKLNITLADVKLRTICKWQLEFQDSVTYQGSPDGFEVEIELDSDATEDDLKKLLKIARGSCFVEQTIIQGTSINHRLKSGDNWVELDATE